MAVIIDAKDTLLGRLAAIAAKKALSGEQVVIINADKAVVSGGRDFIFEDYRAKRQRGERYHGPHFPRQADKIVKRTIRGMVPWHQPKGREAMRRIRVHIGKPEDIAGTFLDISKFAGSKRLSTGAQRLVRLDELSSRLG